MERGEVAKKVCTRCKIEKPLTAFHKGPGKDGKHTQCSWCRSDLARERKNQLKKIVFDHYGWICSCSPCGETEPLFLSIDHINNDGKKHRDSLKGNKVTALYRFLIDNNFPGDFRVLCHNCNHGRWLNGGWLCPHISTNLSKLGI